MSENNSITQRIKRKLLRNIPGYYTKWVINHPFIHGLHRIGKRKKQIILTMATYPPRFPGLHICLKSLLRQTVKPDKILVWLDADVRREQFTKEMLEAEKYGVEYRWVAHSDLAPHKKYFQVMQDFPEAIIITADDDVVYPPFLIATLLKAYKKNPGAVCARRVRRMTYDGSGNLRPYSEWEVEYSESTKPRFDLFAVGVGGILYPPHILPAETFHIDKFRTMCPRQDDIWLKTMEMKNSVPVAWAKCWLPHPPHIAGSQEISLFSSNCTVSGNDERLAVMQRYYPREYRRIREYAAGEKHF